MHKREGWNFERERDNNVSMINREKMKRGLPLFIEENPSSLYLIYK
jgi:hypothetical protein